MNGWITYPLFRKNQPVLHQFVHCHPHEKKKEKKGIKVVLTWISEDPEAMGQLEETFQEFNSMSKSSLDSTHQERQHHWRRKVMRLACDILFEPRMTRTGSVKWHFMQPIYHELANLASDLKYRHVSENDFLRAFYEELVTIKNGWHPRINPYQARKCSHAQMLDQVLMIDLIHVNTRASLRDHNTSGPNDLDVYMYREGNNGGSACYLSVDCSRRGIETGIFDHLSWQAITLTVITQDSPNAPSALKTEEVATNHPDPIRHVQPTIKYDPVNRKSTMLFSISDSQHRLLLANNPKLHLFTIINAQDQGCCRVKVNVTFFCYQCRTTCSLIREFYFVVFPRKFIRLTRIGSHSIIVPVFSRTNPQFSIELQCFSHLSCLTMNLLLEFNVVHGNKFQVVNIRPQSINLQDRVNTITITFQANVQQLAHLDRYSTIRLRGPITLPPEIQQVIKFEVLFHDA